MELHLGQYQILMVEDDIEAGILLIEQQVRLLVVRMDPTQLDPIGIVVINPAL